MTYFDHLQKEPKTEGTGWERRIRPTTSDMIECHDIGQRRGLSEKAYLRLLGDECGRKNDTLHKPL